MKECLSLDAFEPKHTKIELVGTGYVFCREAKLVTKEFSINLMPKWEIYFTLMRRPTC